MKYEKKPSITEKEWKYVGLKCKVIFVRQQHRCGYVRVPRSHLAYGISYDDLPIDVHGGLTFGDLDSTTEEFEWFGFDCAHAGDKDACGNPTYDVHGHYWTLEEVMEETNKMAEQFQKLTLRQIIKHKLEYMPSWFKDNVRIVVDEVNEKERKP